MVFPSSHSLPEPEKKKQTDPYEIVVPVFLKVKVPADDEFQAEMKAVEACRALGAYVTPQAVISFAGIISPVQSKKSCQS
jgi:hypothetical protein